MPWLSGYILTHSTHAEWRKNPKTEAQRLVQWLQALVTSHFRWLNLFFALFCLLCSKLFQFYTPKASASAEDGKRSGLESVSRAKAKRKLVLIPQGCLVKVWNVQGFSCACLVGRPVHFEYWGFVLSVLHFSFQVLLEWGFLLNNIPFCPGSSGAALYLLRLRGGVGLGSVYLCILPFFPEKRGVILDADSLKVKLFKMFDAAGAAGLQLKQIAAQTQQPLSHVKAVVEEIAEQRKWASLPSLRISLELKTYGTQTRQMHSLNAALSIILPTPKPENFKP